MKRLSERLGDLSARAKQTEDTIDAALAQNREHLRAQRDALTARVEAQQDRFSQHAAEAPDGARVEMAAASRRGGRPVRHDAGRRR